MKFKTKLVSALLGTVLLSGTAQAAIENGQLTGAYNAGGSELFLAAYDGNTTYVRDLGIGFNDMLTLGSASFTADAGLTSILGAGLQWMVVGGDANSGATGDFNLDNWGFRFLGTSSTGGPSVGGGTAAQRSAALSAASQGANNFGQAHSLIQGGTVADNFSSSVPNGDAAEWSAFVNAAGGIGTNVSGVAGLLGDTLDMFLYTSVSQFIVPGNVVTFLDREFQQLAGTWTLDSAGTLTYGTTVIPVPAAVWLFGSALLGLVGVSRRKQQLALS